MLTGLVVIAPALATARPAIRAGHHRFVPRTGDWEGTARGFPASFELLYKPGYAAYGPKYTSYGFEDVVTLLPATCPISSSRYSEGVIGDHFPTPVYAGGSLHLRSYGFPGGLSGSRSATLRTSYNFPRQGSTPGCKGRLVWHLRPAHRHPVSDGTWRLRFSEGSAETVAVHGQGRLVQGISFPPAFAQCAGLFGGVDLFIKPGGRAAASYPKLQLSFRRRSVTGTLGSLPGSGQRCASESIKGQLLKRTP